MRWGSDPYICKEAEAYTTAVNILAVEYLIKTDNHDEYSRRINQVYKLTDVDLDVLFVYLSLNMHTSSLGAMITQGDYDYQRDILLEFLDKNAKNPDEIP